MYERDKFFSLTMPARFGLVFVSAGLAALTTAAFIKTICRMVWRLRLLLAPATLWLSDHLPLQNVVQPPPRPSQIARLMGFSGKAALSHHATGLLGWGLITFVILGEDVVPSKRRCVALRL